MHSAQWCGLCGALLLCDALCDTYKAAARHKLSLSFLLWLYNDENDDNDDNNDNDVIWGVHVW